MIGILTDVPSAGISRIRICIRVAEGKQSKEAMQQLEGLRWQALEETLHRFDDHAEVKVVLDEKDGVEDFEEWVRVVESRIGYRTRVGYAEHREFLA